MFKSNFNRNLKLDNGVKIIANGLKLWSNAPIFTNFSSSNFKLFSIPKIILSYILSNCITLS
ncbi:hypothetical protein, partial [Clostridioides difficile]|uniref:hypothetical protein n=1 Tax=Clostridioides difficile TaxID=1496 RepID=UPI001F1D28C9